MRNISYSKIVFGLKHHQRLLYDCRQVIEQARILNIIISEHDAVTDACERPGLHYHGILEEEVGKEIDISDFVNLLRIYCTYYKIENCDKPEQFVVELARPPKIIMVIEIANSYGLKTFYGNMAIVGSQLGLSDFEKDLSQMEAIKYIISNVTSKKIFKTDNLWKKICNWDVTLFYQSDALISQSVDLLQQKMLDQSILVLCGRFLEVPENYYSVLESAELIFEWCQFQDIDVEQFTMNWIKCFDRQVSYKNSLYFQGSLESGALNIINSIAEACSFIGEIERETTGYTYVWEGCLEKRCIIMHDPIFDERMFEELENIFRGIGTLVPHRKSYLKYLRPTPIVICSQTDEDNLYLQRLQTSFLESYVNLKPFAKLIDDPRQLHPDWLNVLYRHFTGNATFIRQSQ